LFILQTDQFNIKYERKKNISEGTYNFNKITQLEIKNKKKQLKNEKQEL
jgi:hypothetical protein